MNNLLDGILNYLDMESTGALMVSGEWGCGKTYHIENDILPKLKEKEYNTVKVSLFGIESVNEIPLKIAENYVPQKLPEKEKKGLFRCSKGQAGRLAAKGTELLTSVKWLENFVDVKALAVKYGDLLYKAIPTDKTVIFLDDIERVVETIDIHTLLGVINGLVEHRKYKVVVIANNSYIDRQGETKLVFKEKVIEKTLVYNPDVVAIYKEICDTNYKDPFRGFMKSDEAISVIDPKFPSYKQDEDLLTNLKNIRIVKFALSHFHRIFEACEGFLQGEEQSVVDKFRLSLWACTVGLAVEYKRNRLTYQDREQFAAYVDMSAIDWQLDDGSKEAENLLEENEKTKNEEERRTRASNRVAYIFQKIVKAHNLPVIVSIQVFDFLTAGMSIDKVGLKAVWEQYKANVKRNRITPAYALLQCFLQQQWNMSNNEMNEALLQLAKFVEEGEFCDNMSYVNAATYLQHLRELTPYSQTELEAKIKTGIDKMYERMTTLNLLDKVNLDVVESEIPNKSRWVVEYERNKMMVVSDTTRDADIKEVCRQFNEDLPALDKRLSIQYNSTDTPDFMDYPILSHIPKEDIVKKLQDIEPKEVMALYDILNSRFIQVSIPKRYNTELIFVRNLTCAIDQRKSDKKVYADLLIEDYLLKTIEKILPKNQVRH